ncbi:hypothetical protein FHX45_000256 [Amycolatopsis granulosa]|nr:hypothetical protein [Amycolatopsis granulosa]
MAGSASPLAMASTGGDPAPPVPAAETAPVADAAHVAPVLGPPSTWVVSTPASVLDIPARPAHPEPAAAETPAAAPVPPPPPPPPPEVFDTSGDQLAGWVNEALRVMKSQGMPVGAGDVRAIRTIIDKESGGDPQAVNRWDSNWIAGHPSKGLMQCIDSTFEANKLPGHDDIFDPVDNIIAGVRYTFDRYGSFAGHPGLKSMSQGSGYRGY